MPAQAFLESESVENVTLSATTMVRIPADDQMLRGELIIPPSANGVVVCAGSRTECAAEMIRGAGNATLRLELLTTREQREDELTRSYRFNVPLLAQRLVAATRWLAHQPATATFGFGYLGEEIAGAAALVAAGELGVVVDAVVCRHTRPDFAANSLPRIEAATLLICTKNDDSEVTVNRCALGRLKCEKQLQLIPPPCNRSTETPPRDCVACSLAAAWFKTYVRPR